MSPFLCFLLLGDEGAADCFSFLCASGSLVSFVECDGSANFNCLVFKGVVKSFTIFVEFLKRIYFLVSIEGKTPTKQINK